MAISKNLIMNAFKIGRVELNKKPSDVIKFKTYYNNLYKHQQDAFDKINDNNIGQVICPTGSGKSKIQIATFFKHLEDHPDQHQNYLIASHRLLLNTQLISNLISDVKKSVRPFRILYVGSAKVSANTINKDLKDNVKIKDSDFKQTTDVSKIRKFIKNANDNKYDVLIVSTYHSVHLLKDINIEIACFDEAHTTAGRDEDEGKFRRNINKLKNIKRKYFFTATRKVYNDIGGMNNTDFYGEVIYEVSPKDMVDGNYICEPRFHLVHSQNVGKIKEDSLKNSKMEVKTILESFSAHNQIVKENAVTAGRKPPLSAKMLVNTPGTGSMQDYIKSKELKEYSKNNKCVMLFIASDEKVGCTYIKDGKVDKNLSRDKWMSLLNNLEDHDSAIIFHYDILTEGIDLPNITGTLFTRKKGVTKLMQSVGRSLRLISEDRKNVLENKSVLPTEKNKQVKPFGYVILPSGFLIEDDDASDMKELISTIINEYEIPEENLKLDNTNAKGTTTISIDEVGTGLEDDSDKRLIGLVDEIYHEIKDGRIREEEEELYNIMFKEISDLIEWE